MKIKIDESIVLPDICDKMSEDLRQHLLMALTDASERYECSYTELRWKVQIDPTNKMPIISVRKAA